MQQYSTYKPSNVEWLGDVPTNWKVDKLKNYCDIFASNVDKKIEEGEIEVSLCNYVDVYKNEKIDRSIDFMIASATQAEIEKFTLQLNDIILTKDSETPDDIAVPAIVKEVFKNFLCGYHLSIIRCQKKIEPDFLIWALRDLHIATQFHREAVGITRFGLASKHFKNGIFAIPSRAEQTAIAAFLDQATANIDKVIATKQKQLEKLEQYKQSKIHECVTKGLNPDVTLKPSGIDWIGEVPSHWKVEKIKRRMSFVYGSALKEEDRVEGQFNVYGSNGIVGTHELAITDGETIIIGRKGTAGALNYSYLPCYPIDTAYFIDKTATEANIRFLYFALQTLDLDKMNEDSAVPGLSRENAYQKQLAFPPRAEQKELAEYLDDFCNKISKEKSIIEQQIEKLKQYRKCLIHECVTGKRKVINDK